MLQTFDAEGSIAQGLWSAGNQSNDYLAGLRRRQAFVYMSQLADGYEMDINV